MSDSIFDLQENDAPVMTQENAVEEIPTSSSDAPDTNKKKLAWSIWDSMALISLICVVLACVLLLFELREFSPSYPFSGSNPWNVSGQ